MSDQQTEEVQPSPPPTPAPRDATVDEEKLGLRHRLSIVLATLGVAGGIRVLIGVLGIGGFVAGVILAWHASSATTLLVVSAALLLFAAIGTEWEEVVASWGLRRSSCAGSTS
jgi:DNA segregation ATPase FtsK/SpoIIIE-like protein